MAVGYLLPAGWLADVNHRLVGVMNVWTLLVPAALFFFGAGMLFPLATSGAMKPFPFLASGARWSAVCKTFIPACWRRSLQCCRNRSGRRWVIDDLNGIVDRAVLAAAGDAVVEEGQPV